MGVGAGLIGGPDVGHCSTSSCSATTRRRGRPGRSAPTTAILLVIGMFGGNDGLNTVVPFNDGALLPPARRAGDPRRPDAADSRRARAQPAADRAQAVLGRRSAGGRAGRRLPERRLLALQLDGELDGRAGRRDPVDRVGSGAGSTATSAAGRDLYAAAEVGHSVPLHMIGDGAARHRRADRPPELRRRHRRQRLRRCTRRSAPCSTPAHGPWHGAVGQAFVDQLDLAATLVGALSRRRRPAGRPRSSPGSRSRPG